MDKPLVSIVTPSLDQGRFIEEALRSVREQDYPNVEHVIVDGGSTDGTLEILRRYPHLRWISERDGGQTDAIRKGFEMAQGEIFGWLNADDIYLPGAVSVAVEALQSTGAGLAYGGYRVIREDGEVAFEIPPHPFDLETLLDAKNFIPQPSAFFTREAYETVRGIDARYHYAMDYDLWLRIAKRFDVRVIDGILSGFRFQPDSKSVVAADRFYPEMRRISRRNGGRFLSRMFLYQMPARHPQLFKAVILARIIRRRDVTAFRRAVGRGR